MKTIYLRVQVPDKNFGIDSCIKALREDVTFTEIQLPSEEEIESKAKSVTRNEFGLKGFKMGATWLLNKMIGE